jgi:hypothetical protein
MRYARGEAILRVIAMRYAPQLIVSQNKPLLIYVPSCFKNSTTSQYFISRIYLINHDLIYGKLVVCEAKRLRKRRRRKHCLAYNAV